MGGRWEEEGRCWGEEGGTRGEGRGIRMNHGAFSWGGFHFVTAQFCLTDGKTTCFALEKRALGPDLIRGAKLLLVNKPRIRRGLILLEPQNVVVVASPAAPYAPASSPVIPPGVGGGGGGMSAAPVGS